MNINQDNDDPFYRYKMPKLITRLAGGGNGSYTFLDNINEVSMSINTPSLILFNFIAKSIGSSCNLNKKTITGHHSNDKIIKEIFKFINFFVLCEKCKIPEVMPEIKGTKKNKDLYFNCSACGASYLKSSSTKLFDKTIDNIIKNVKTYKITKGNIVITN